MSDKIWIVERKGRYTKKKRTFKSETEMIKSLTDSDQYIITEYELKSTQNASDYIKSKERDTQLRTVLGELSDHETNGLRLIELYESLAPVDPNDRYNKKASRITNLKKLISDKKSLAAYLIREKKHFLTVSESTEWLLAILKCHNFQDYKYERDRWDSNTRTYIRVDNTSETFRENFKLAKKELKGKK